MIKVNIFNLIMWCIWFVAVILVCIFPLTHSIGAFWTTVFMIAGGMGVLGCIINIIDVIKNVQL